MCCRVHTWLAEDAPRGAAIGVLEARISYQASLLKMYQYLLTTQMQMCFRTVGKKSEVQQEPLLAALTASRRQHVYTLSFPSHIVENGARRRNRTAIKKAPCSVCLDGGGMKAFI